MVADLHRKAHKSRPAQTPSGAGTIALSSNYKMDATFQRPRCTGCRARVWLRDAAPSERRAGAACALVRRSVQRHRIPNLRADKRRAGTQRDTGARVQPAARSDGKDPGWADGNLPEDGTRT